MTALLAEAALAAQMVAVHWMQMRLAARALNQGYMILEKEAALAGKLARTYAIQLEALAKLKGKRRVTRQSIKVSRETHHHQHIHVHRGTGENDGQPHARNTYTPDQCTALPGPDSSRQVMPIASRAREARVPHARGEEPGRPKG